MFPSAALIDARRCLERSEVIGESDWEGVSAPLIDARRCFERSEAIGESDSPLIDARRCFEWSEAIGDAISRIIGESDWEGGARGETLEVAFVA